MITGKREGTKKSERGIALIIALLTLLLVSAISIGLIAMSNTETNISANFRDEQTAFFAARAGTEEIRDRLRGAATNSLSGNLPTVVPGNTNGVLYVTNPLGAEAVAPWTSGSSYTDREICNEVTCASGTPAGAPWYTTASASASYAANPTLIWKWTRVTLDTNRTHAPNYVNGSNASGTLNNQICWNGTNEFVLPTGVANCPSATPPAMPVYLLTSFAVNPSGAHRMVQSEVTLNIIPPLPGALTFAGPNPVYGSTNSNPFHIDGTDSASPACPPAGNKPAIAAYDSAGATALTTDLARPDHYTGYPPGSSTAVAPSVSNTGPSATPPANTMGTLATVSGLQNLVDAVTAMADQVIPAGSSPTAIGTASNPLVTVVQGDLSLAAVHGYGILLVEGNLTFTGNTSWDGVILVIGNGNLTVSGGGGGQINGGVLVANINTGVVGNTPGSPVLNWSGGGGNGIYYNSCDVDSLYNNRSAYRVVATHELMY
jgi:Tfp pilus assembly protein PilX